MNLAEQQLQLAALLAGRGTAGKGLEGEALERTRRSLVHKRRRAAAHLLPHLARRLGAGFAPLFADHAARYSPSGLLQHVDDAWELAEVTARAGGRGEAAGRAEVRAAARDDLALLRLRYRRDPAKGLERVAPREGWVVVLLRKPRLRLAVRLPGRAGRVIWVPLLP